MESNEKVNGRNPLLITGGFMVLGLALMLLLFGGDLLRMGGGEDERETAVLPQVPALSELAPAEDAVSGGPAAIGSPAPDFTLTDLDGNVVQLSALRGQPVIINFWATWCAPCRIEMPELEATFQAHQADGLVVLALNQQESSEQVRDFFYQEMGLTFTPLLDREGIVQQGYGVGNALPTTYFVDEMGVVTAVHRGLLVSSQIENYLAEILP